MRALDEDGALTRVTPALASIERTCLFGVTVIRQMASRRLVRVLVASTTVIILGKYRCSRGLAVRRVRGRRQHELLAVAASGGGRY